MGLRWRRKFGNISTRKGRLETICEDIPMESYRQHFMNELKGTEEKSLKEEKRDADETDGEIERQIGRLKNKKAARPDG